MKKRTEKWYDQGIRYALYALVIAIPVLFSPAFHTVFSAPKLLALRLITLFIFLLWGAKIYIEERLTFRRGALNIALFSYAIISILTTIYSVAFYTSLLGAQGRFIGIFTILNLLILPLFIWNHLNKKQVIDLLKISTITASALALYGIAQYFGVFQEGFNWDQSAADRVFGTIGHGNHFGAYLGMNLLLGIFLIPTFSKKWQKNILILGLILQFTALFLTASRGAVISTWIALSIVLFNFSFQKWDTVKTIIKKLLLPGFIIISITVAGFVVFDKDIDDIPLVNRTIATISAAEEGVIPDRFSWWMSSLDMIAEKPLLGFGLSTFRDIYNQFRRTDYRTLEDNGMQDNITPESAHNEYLNIAATQGLLGLAAFLSIIVLIIWNIDKLLFAKRNKLTSEFYPILGVKAAILVYLFQVAISFGVVATMSIFYIFIGCAFALTDKQTKSTQQSIKGLTKGALTLILFFGLSTATITTLNSAWAEVHYKQALIALKEDGMEPSIQKYQAMVNAQPFDYAYYQIFADAALQYSRTAGISDDLAQNLTDLAIANYESAIIINDLHPSTFYNLGIAYLQRFAYTGSQGDYSNAEYNLENAVAKAPNNPLYPYQAAKAFETMETPEARQKAADYYQQAINIRDPFRDAQPALEQVMRVIQSQPQTAQ